jgi:hypothetical protein
MKNSVMFIIVLALTFLACNKAEQAKTDTSDGLVQSAENILSENGGEGCFIPYQAKVCELIDKATIAQILGVDATKMEAVDNSKMLHQMGKKKNEPYKGSKYTKCEYKWEDKNKKIKEYVEQLGTSIEVPISAIVQIGSFTPQQSVASFKQYYRNVSENELNKAMKQAGDQMGKSGKYTKEQVDIATDMGKGLAAGRVVTYLDNLGEAAVSIRSKAFGEQTELIVFYKGNEFQVSVKMSGKTYAENMEYSLKIAKEVLSKCK